MLLSDGAVAPISFADAAPQFGRPNYYPASGLALTARFATYGAIYQSQPWVASLVNKIAYGVARLPLKVYVRDSDGARAESRDTPLANLLGNPNQRHDPFYFWLWTASTHEVYGEALWLKVRPAPGKPPTALFPLHPSNIYSRVYRGEPDQNWWCTPADVGQVVHYYHMGSANVPLVAIAESDVVHFRSYNPANEIRGLSRLEPLRSTLVTEDSIRRAQAAWYKHGARPSAFLTHPKTLNGDVSNRLKAQWDDVHSSVDNWGKTAILEEGMTANILQLDAVQMDLIASLQLTREEACAVFDVPPPAVHILDHATFSNITEQMRSLYRDTMAPRLGLFESVMDSQLRPDFGDRSLYAEFLLDEVLRGDFEQRSTAYETMTRIGAMTPGEVRERENLPDLGDATHRLYVNAAQKPLDDDSDDSKSLFEQVAAAGALVRAGYDPAAALAAVGLDPIAHLGLLPVTLQAPEQVSPAELDALKSTTVRTLMGRLARVPDMKSVNPAELVGGLNGEATFVLAQWSAARDEDLTIDEFRLRLRALTSEDHA